MSKIMEMLEAAIKCTPMPWEVCREPPNNAWTKGKTIGTAGYGGNRVADTCEMFTGAHPEYGKCEVGIDAYFIECATKALPDIKRIVEYLQNAKHGAGCLWWWEKGNESGCTCGLSEIQSLIRR